MKVESVARVIRALNGAGVEYLVVGGLAVNAWNFVRPTKDMDLVIRLTETNLKCAFAALSDLGYLRTQHVTAEEMANPAKRREWRESKGMVCLKLWSDRFPDLPIDVFIEEPFDFNREKARAMPHTLSGEKVPVVTLGTLLRMKRAAGRSRDLEDVRALGDLYNL